MFDHERPLNEFMVKYLVTLAGDLDEAELDRQLVEGMNPPRWILGHLAVYTDYGLRTFGQRFRCPIDWHRHYARGTESTSRPASTPTKSQLLVRITEGFAQIRDQCASADPTAMNQPHAVPFLKETPIQTAGDVLSHLMTTHLATHTGQLSFWRRAVGRPRIDLAEIKA